MKERICGIDNVGQCLFSSILFSSHENDSLDSD